MGFLPQLRASAGVEMTRDLAGMFLSAAIICAAIVFVASWVIWILT